MSNKGPLNRIYDNACQWLRLIAILSSFAFVVGLCIGCIGYAYHLGRSIFP